MVEYRKYVIGLLVSASTLIALYVNVFLGIDTVYTHFFYVPVVLTAIWYYWKSAYLAAALGAMHVSIGIYATGGIEAGTIIRAASLLAVAIMVAMLSEASGKLYDRVRQASEEEKQSIFNSVEEAIFVHDLDGRIVEVNDCTAHTYRMPKEQAVKLSLSDFFPTLDPGFMQAWEKARAGEKQVFEWTSRRPADGSTFPAEVSLHRIRLQDRDVIIASARDITGSKRAEEELGEARKRAELYVDLMGHDINNLNQVGIGYLEMALDTMDGDDERKKLLRHPLESMQNSSRLIENVRKLQSIQAEGRRHEVIDLGGMLADVKAEYARFADREVTIEYQPVPDCLVQASRLIKEAFGNLVSNAIRHSAGRVTIKVTLEEKKSDGMTFYQVGIEDDGPGIPDAVKPKLLSRAMSGRARIKGRGLGLYLARTVIEDAGGTIQIEDRIPGDYTRGSRFVIILPACERK